LLRVCRGVPLATRLAAGARRGATLPTRARSAAQKCAREVAGRFSDAHANFPSFLAWGGGGRGVVAGRASWPRGANDAPRALRKPASRGRCRGCPFAFVAT